MKMFVVFVILLHVSQHALAVVVEVNEGENSVLLPCQYSGSIPEDNPIVMWTRSDLEPTNVHLQQNGKDDLKEQNQRYSGRTSVRPDALNTGNFSLTLTKPELADSGTYTCSITDGSKELRLTGVQLHVKDQQVEVKVEEGSESVILPCKTKPDLPEDTTVEWTRSDPQLMMVHVYSNRSEHLKKQDGLYRDRTKTNEDLLRTGDLSLTLKHPTERDTGGYICTIYRDKDILRQKVVLHVKEPFPSWATALLVLLVLLVVSGGLLFHFRDYFKSVYQVEVDSGLESVLLPCKIIVHLPEDAKVEWRDRKNRMVHVYQKGSYQSEEPDQIYRDRTEMKRSLLQPGDLSLILKHPTDGDTDTYTCTVYNGKENILMKKDVKLEVKVPQVEVEEGVESVLLPFRTTENLPEDAKVEWMDRNNRKVHMYQNVTDQPEDQDWVYRDRTEMKKSLLQPGDLSLTLKHPTERDTETYTCTVYSREGNILMKKQVELKVKVPQVEVDSEVESVQLPWKTTVHLPEDSEVEWVDRNNKKLYVYQKGSDQPENKSRAFIGRTEMNEDLLRSGDLSLTLKCPTERDTNTYTCTIYSRERVILKKKRVNLKVIVCQVEVEEGVESVLLPFKTTGNLPGDARVEWERIEPKPFLMVHVYQNGSDQPDKQNQVYRDRTKMNKDLLRTGDLSLTLKHPTERDSGRYRCEVESKEIWRYKTVFLKVKGTVQVQDQTGDIRNRSSSTDPTPLMADQSV